MVLLRNAVFRVGIQLMAVYPNVTKIEALGISDEKFDIDLFFEDVCPIFLILTMLFNLTILVPCVLSVTGGFIGHH